jgi:hypothetical protein
MKFLFIYAHDTGTYGSQSFVNTLVSSINLFNVLDRTCSFAERAAINNEIPARISGEDIVVAFQL